MTRATDGHLPLPFARFPFLLIPPIASPFLARTPSCRFDALSPKSLSNEPPLETFALFFFFDLDLDAGPLLSGSPNLTGREAFFAERTEAFIALPSPASASSSIASFLRLAFRDSPANLSRFGWWEGVE